jgi:hypothetical protein
VLTISETHDDFSQFCDFLVLHVNEVDQTVGVLFKVSKHKVSAAWGSLNEIQILRNEYKNTSFNISLTFGFLHLLMSRANGLLFDSRLCQSSRLFAYPVNKLYKLRLSWEISYIYNYLLHLHLVELQFQVLLSSSFLQQFKYSLYLIHDYERFDKILKMNLENLMLKYIQILQPSCP